MSGDEHDFDEALISGFLDGELTQGDRQRVRVHLDTCAECRRIADEMTSLKEATMTTTFPVPDDTQWDETPRNGVSRLLQYLGWSLAVAWVVGLVALLIWQAIADEESIRFEAIVGIAPVLAVALIVGSALVDRLDTRSTDPYRKVKK